MSRSPVSLVPAGARFEGRLVFRGEVCVEGEVEGPIEAEGRLRVGPESRVAGPVTVDGWGGGRLRRSFSSS